tara:strand:+ start:3250 stop:3603 length:354 start_codon:yes stop_codon:yes gene_type:complete
MNDEMKERIKSLIESLDEETPPSSVKEAERAIKTNMIVYLQGYVTEDFWYNGWKEGPKRKFDKARMSLIVRLANEIEKKPIVLPTLVERETNSAFEFDVKEIKEDVLTLQDYLEMNK